eukprot:TRINITY_DN31727_c0_g2_i1.p1 TRINITY_DN31727_c0_g2~~TRINITY_DN31727_c0_g2_i1.p1  ORF type:complete len:801 (-),score=202.54 TRINITY_DN31727_c0_g2_i1:65-2467(-)
MRLMSGGGMAFAPKAASAKHASAGGGWHGGPVVLADIAAPVPILPPLARRKRPNFVPWLGVAAEHDVQDGNEDTVNLQSERLDENDHGLAALMTPGEMAAVAAANALADQTAAAKVAAAAASEAAAAADDDDEGADADRLQSGEGEPSFVDPTTGETDVAADTTTPTDGDVSLAASGSLMASAKASRQCLDEDMQKAEEFLAKSDAKRQHVFITCPPGVGKTTMVQRLLATLKEEEGEGVEIAGFYTEEVRDPQGLRSGFDVVRVGEPLSIGDAPPLPQRVALARIGQAQPKVGKYTVDVGAFDAFALPALAPPPEAPPLPEAPLLHTGIGGVDILVDLLEEGVAEPASAKKADKAGEASSLPEFEPASTFAGARRGMCFKLGQFGLGYYLDPYQVAAAAAHAVSKKDACVADTGGVSLNGTSSCSIGDFRDSDSFGGAPPRGSSLADDDAINGVEAEAVVRYCKIVVPATGEEAIVEESTLRPLPAGWKSPQQELYDERLRYPRLCVCDEVGKMALLSLKFAPTLLSALDEGGTVLLGTLPQAAKGQRDSEVVDRVKRRSDVRLVRITRNNRDELPAQVYAQLRESLGLGPPGTGKKRSKRRTSQDDAEERKAEEEARKAKAADDAKRIAELKAKRQEDARKKQKLAKAKEAQRYNNKKARKARELRKKRDEVRRRAREIAQEGAMDVEEEDEVEAVANFGELDVDDDDESSMVAELAELDSDDCSAVEDVDAVLDVESMKRPNAVAPKAKPKPKAVPVLGKLVTNAAKLAKPGMAPILVGRQKGGKKTVLNLEHDEVL